MICLYRAFVQRRSSLCFVSFLAYMQKGCEQKHGESETSAYHNNNNNQIGRLTAWYCTHTNSQFKYTDKCPDTDSFVRISNCMIHFFLVHSLLFFLSLFSSTHSFSPSTTLTCSLSAAGSAVSSILLHLRLYSSDTNSAATTPPTTTKQQYTFHNSSSIPTHTAYHVFFELLWMCACISLCRILETSLGGIEVNRFWWL